jgi:hypothetical protein
MNLKRSLLFLLLNIAGKSTVKYIDTSLDWADNNEKWNSWKIRLDDKVLKGSTVFSLDKSPLPFQALKEGSPYKDDDPHTFGDDIKKVTEGKLCYLLKMKRVKNIVRLNFQKPKIKKSGE